MTDFPNNVVRPETPEQAAESQPRRRIELRPVRDVKMRPVRWLWENRVPLGELTLVVGRAGIGKSINAVWLASRVTRGQLDGEHKGKPRAVLYIATEDSWEHTVAPRFTAAGADLDLVYQVQVLTEEDRETSLSLVIDLDELRTAVQDSGAVLVVVDALLSTMTGADMYKATEVRRVLEPVAQLAHDLNVAILGLAHFRKSGGVDPLTMVAGSTAFGDVIRSAIGFARDENAADGACVLSPIKSNLAPGDVPSLRYRIEEATVQTAEGPASVGRYVSLGEASTTVQQLLRESDEPEARTDRESAAEWLRAYLTDDNLSEGRAKSADVKKAARAAGFSERTLARARASLKVHVVDHGFPRESYWSLPPDDSHASTDHADLPAEASGTTGATGDEQRKHTGSDGQHPQLCHPHGGGTTGQTGTTGDPATARALYLLKAELGAVVLDPTGTEGDR